MGETSTIYLYHVNSLKEIKKCINSFENNKPKLYTAKEDGYWAGNGMYFWDNIGNAQYWLKRSKKEHPVILKAKLTYSSEDILDLTDSNVLFSFQKFWPKISNKFRIEENVSLGKKVNVITKIFHGKIKLVKEIGLYPTLKENAFLNVTTQSSKKPHVTSTVRTIYCIKDISVLSDLKIVNED